MNAVETARVRIGISSCLLGENVRFDGGHKKDDFLVNRFGRYVEWVPLCPEVEIGLGIPRETLRLIDQGNGARLVAATSGLDHTESMTRWTRDQMTSIAERKLCGYVFKSNSPSCGLVRVKVYGSSGLSARNGRGLLASGVVNRFPNLPVEEEGRLSDPRLRENFVSQVFCYRRWLDLQKERPTHPALMRFHARHKFLLVAHQQSGAKLLGNLLGESSRSAPSQLLGKEYFTRFCEVMRHTPTRRNHTNVLQHMAGYFSNQLDTADRAELSSLIGRYREEQLPLIVPITLIRHYVRKFNIEYLQDQIYLNPHPDELNLLNGL